MSITIANANRSVILNKVIQYSISAQSEYADYDIPGKTTPTVDTDTVVIKPTIYHITADIGDGEKWVLELMRTERNLAFTLKDQESPTRNVRVQTIETTPKTGKTTEPDKWTATLAFKATDH